MASNVLFVTTTSCIPAKHSPPVSHSSCAERNRPNKGVVQCFFSLFDSHIQRFQKQAPALSCLTLMRKYLIFQKKIIMYNGGVDFYDANIMDYEKQVS